MTPHADAASTAMGDRPPCGTRGSLPAILGAVRNSRKRVKTREQERRALAERGANRRAARDGEPLPYPNIWDELDPTKAPPDATPEEIHERYKEFRKLCPPRPRIEHTL